MGLTVQILQYTGAADNNPQTSVNVAGGSFRWTRDDINQGTTPVPTPSTSNTTNFSWPKSTIVNISAQPGGQTLTMTNLKVGRTADYPISGVKVWYIATHTHNQYLQANSGRQPATDNSSNNANAPTINSVVSQAMPLLTGAAVYALASPGGQSSLGLVDIMIEMVLGVDSGNSTAGTQTVCTLRWQWTEQ